MGTKSSALTTFSRERSALPAVYCERLNLQPSVPLEAGPNSTIAYFDRLFSGRNSTTAIFP
jgi:hypothetical protein